MITGAWSVDVWLVISAVFFSGSSLLLRFNPNATSAATSSIGIRIFFVIFLNVKNLLFGSFLVIRLLCSSLGF